MTGKTATGKCLCGAVRFEASDVPDSFGVCHCEMCRRWTGSALLEVSVPTGSVTWQGEDHIATRRTSDWAERAWCRECGSALYYKVTMTGEFAGNFDIPLGLFDDPDPFTMTHEIYIDKKPESFSFAGDDRKLLTRQDCIDRFSLLGET